MENENTLLRIENLTNIDIMEIEEELGDNVVKVADPSIGLTNRHGDFGLTAVILILGTVALTNLAVWLAKKRVRTEDLQHMKVTVSDGTVSIDITTISKSGTSAPPDAATVTALTSGLREVIQQAISLTGSGSMVVPPVDLG